MQEIWEQMRQLIGEYIPVLLAALAILIIGWLVARIISGLVGRSLRKTNIGNKMATWISGEEVTDSIKLERWVARTVFWLVMLFVLIGFFQVLELTLITVPLNELLNQVFQYAPRVFGAAMLLVVAWIVATLLRFVVIRAMTASKIEERLVAKTDLEEDRRVPLTKSLAEAVYWLVFLLFLPGVLDAMGLQGLLEPVRGMLGKVLGILPNLFAAGLILLVGWFVARVLQRVVTNLLISVGADNIGKRAGLSAFTGKQQLSGFIGLIVYVMVFIPVLIAALNVLKLDAITAPASNMLDAFLGAVPAIFAALVVLVIAYVVAKVVAGLITRVLSGAGFDGVLRRLGLVKESAHMKRTPSEIVGGLTLLGIMLFAATEAAALMDFGWAADLLSRFLVFGGQVILGLIIFGIGLYLANLVARALIESQMAHAGILALAARIAILVLTSAMALRQMGLANEIINMAFGLIVGTLAVAVALAVGIGGREIAAEEIKNWLQSIRSKK